MKRKYPGTSVKRQPQLAVKNTAALKAILRTAPFCQVAIVENGAPMIIPMAFVTTRSHLYLHGSTQSRLMKTLAAGAPTCVSVTLYDGLVLAKSAFSHSMNYRSVSIFGAAKEIKADSAKLSVLKALSDKYVPGRWKSVRFPTKAELASVMILRIGLATISGKVRSGPPDDFEKDFSYPVWSGVVPYELVPRKPEHDPNSAATFPVPKNVLDVVKRGAL